MVLLWWHWAIIGLLLLIGEALGAAGFLLGLAVSAGLVSLLLALGFDLVMSAQLIIFSVIGVLLSWRLSIWFKQREQHQDHPLLNDRAAQLVGRVAIIQNVMGSGAYKVSVGDTLWMAKGPDGLNCNDQVTVIEAQQNLLIITS